MPDLRGTGAGSALLITASMAMVRYGARPGHCTVHRGHYGDRSS